MDSGEETWTITYEKYIYIVSQMVVCTIKKNKAEQQRLLFSCSVMSNSLQHDGLLHASLPVLHYLPEFAQTHVHWVDDAIQSFHPLSSPSPPALNLSQLRVFSNGMAVCIRWPKYWSFSLSISSSNEYSELISFRIDWFDLLGVQGSGCNVKLGDQERPTEKVIDKQRASGAQKSLWNSRREVFL